MPAPPREQHYSQLSLDFELRELARLRSLLRSAIQQAEAAQRRVKAAQAGRS